ncbi:MAG: hypothetical protein IPO33_10470 [Saprospiraceae bacterium]|nr:hypothetical protein [Candidatus Brachybacter algidus]
MKVLPIVINLQVHKTEFKMDNPIRLQVKILSKPNQLDNTAINKETTEVSSNKSEDKRTKNDTANQSSDIKMQGQHC